MAVAADRVTWAFENEGARVPLDPTSAAAGWVKGAGMSGTSVAPTALVVDPSAAGGGRFRSNRRKPRVVTVPVLTFGADRVEVEARLRRLVRVLDDRWGAPRLAATYPDGTVFDAECHLSGGGDQQWGSHDTDGRTYCRWVLQVTCPDPYFTARTATRFTVGGGPPRGLLTGDSLAYMELAASQTLGTVSLSNPGDVEAWPVWRVAGPGSRVVLTGPAGDVLTYVGSVTAGGPLLVDMGARTVTSTSGVNLYPGLVGAPAFFPLPPGPSTVTLEVDGSDPTTTVTLSFRERREVVY